MGHIRRTIILLLACLGVPFAYANHAPQAIDLDALSSPRMDVFNAGDGLPNLTLVSISATNDGHIWAGTMRGLARFNGLRFVTVDLPNVASSTGMISAVLAVNNQQVWAAPANDGIYLWNGRTWRHFRAGQEFPGFDVRRLRAIQTRNGMRVFATTNEGMVAVWDGVRWAELKLNYRLRGKEIFDILLIQGQSAAQDEYWIATYNAGLLRCHINTACEEIIVPGETRFFEISSLSSIREQDGSTSIWAGSYGGGVARLNKKSWQRFTAKDGHLNGDYVHDLVVVNPNSRYPELWVGTRNGLSRYKDGKWQRHNSNQLMTSRVRGLSISQSGQGHSQLWAATDNGAARLHIQSAWRTVSRLSENGNGVWATLFEANPDGSERLWLGSDGDGLWRYENSVWTQFNIPKELATDRVRSIIRTSSGELWLGLWNGHIVELNGNTLRKIETPWPKSEQQAVTGFLNDGKNGLWVALRTRGVAHFDGNHWQWFDPKLTGAPEFVLGLSKTGTDANPVIWASSKGQGLGRFYLGKWQRFTTWNSELPDDNLATVNVYSDELKRTVLWIGTQSKGLIRMDVSNPNKPLFITTPALPKPPHPYVYGGVQNSKGDMALCSDYGAAFWKKMGVNQFKAIDYHRDDGLPHDECNAGALSFDRFDRAWIGTIGGAAVLTTSNNAVRNTNFHLERLRINQQEQDLLQTTYSYSASHDNAAIDLEFSLLTGERESESRYRTQIIGLDEKPGAWLQSNQRNFSNVPSGNYVLKIEAKDYAGTVAKPLEIRLSIPTPWWRTWWAIALLLATMAFLVSVFVRWRERLLRAREMQLLHLVDKRTGQLERRGKELHRMNDELMRLSYKDTLTGVANRRKLLEELDNSWLQAQTSKSSIAFILMDVDDFKSINDNYGHIRGDECLQRLANQLEICLQNYSCLLGRYGGEEFGIVLTDTSIEQAAVIAEQCRLAIENLQFPHQFGTHGVLTLSLGVAAIIPNQDMSSNTLIAKADTALYLAKQHGKNRMEIAK